MLKIVLAILALVAATMALPGVDTVSSVAGGGCEASFTAALPDFIRLGKQVFFGCLETARNMETIAETAMNV